MREAKLVHVVNIEKHVVQLIRFMNLLMKLYVSETL